MKTYFTFIFAILSTLISVANGLEGKWESEDITLTDFANLKIEYNFIDNKVVEAVYTITMDSTYAPEKYAEGIFTFSGEGTYEWDGEKLSVKVPDMQKKFIIQGINERGEYINANITKESEGNKMVEEWFGTLTNLMASIVEYMNYTSVQISGDKLSATIKDENIHFRRIF